MRILVNHLTRMHGGHICVAGVEVETRRHLRPVPRSGGLSSHLLARYGGPFDMARVVDLGSLRGKPDKPHVEDRVFAPSRARFERSVSAHEFWDVLHYLAKRRLRDIFGSALRAVGRLRYGTDVGRGLASLGCFRPHSPPELYLTTGREGKPQIRMKVSDGEIRADAGVTDLRLYKADHATPDPEVVRGVAKWIAESDCVILSLGLTRKYRPSEDSDYIHWLQVNNIHLEEDPLWQLG